MTLIMYMAREFGLYWYIRSMFVLKINRYSICVLLPLASFVLGSLYVLNYAVSISVVNYAVSISVVNYAVSISVVAKGDYCCATASCGLHVTYF